MHRIILTAGLFVSCILLGCTKSSPSVLQGLIDAKDKGGNVENPGKGDLPKGGDPVSPIADQEKQERFDAQLMVALNLIADKKYADALTILQAAQALHDTEQIRQEIDRVKGLLTQSAAAERTVQDINLVLKDGNADEASKLATAALGQYGGGDQAPRLVKLKQQADAIAAAGLGDNAARKARFTRDGEDALKEMNLRAAALAFEQALEFGDDPALRRRLGEIQSSITQYDTSRKLAAELRADPARIEEALAALHEAAKAWDTPEVRDEIDQYSLALAKRRDRVAVADFEVRGEVGIPLAGRTIAEEVLPGLKVDAAGKAKFDVVERAQFKKIVDELKLEANELMESVDGRQDIGKLARVRFLVLGSVTRLAGLTVNARLVDVQTGVVVQTARVSAPTAEELLKKLPQLAQVLQMNDEEKAAFEARQAAVEVAVAQAGPIPPAPEAPAAQPPAPLIIPNPKPPDFGKFAVEDLEKVPLPPAANAPPPPPVFVIDDPLRDRFLNVAIALGDNFFLRGRHREAAFQFELALNLAPGRPDILIRLERLRPFLAPPVVIVDPVPPPFVLYPRPRVAVLPFFVRSFRPYPWLGGWAADNFAWYFSPRFDLVDPGELYWYMGRLGLTQRDLIHNPWARAWLARALGVRYFVFGYVDEVASFNVRTYMVDAETGWRTGNGFIHVHNTHEMKLRMGELARQTLNDPFQRDRYRQEGEQIERWLTDARLHIRNRKFDLAIDISRTGLRSHPHNGALLSILAQAEREQRDHDLEEARRRQWGLRNPILAAAHRQQQDLAGLAEAARFRTERDALNFGDPERLRRQQERERAHDLLLAQANQALKGKNYPQSIQLFESAVALKPSDAGYRELAQARALANDAAKLQAAEEKARLEAEARKKQEAELARVRIQLDKDKKAREAEELARQKAKEDQENKLQARMLDDAKKLLAQQKFDAAASVLQSALRIQNSDEAQKLLFQATQKQAEALAAKQTADERAKLQKQLEDEKARAAKYEAEAKARRDQFNGLLQEAKKLLAAKKYDEAVPKFKEALKLYQTDDALSGLKQAEQGQAQAEADKKKKQDEEQKAAQVTKLLADGRTAYDGKDYDKALKSLNQAKLLAPNNVDVLALLSRAEQAREDYLAAQRRLKDDQERIARLKKLVDSAQAALKVKQFDAAIAAANDALKLSPNDPAVLALLKDAQAGKAAVSTAEEDAKKRVAEFQKLLSLGQQALNANQHDAAIDHFKKALALLPNDPTASGLLKKAEAAKAAAATVKTDAEVDKLIAQGRAALLKNDLEGASQAFAAAAKLAPKDPDVVKALQELQKARDASTAEADAKKIAAEVDKLLVQGYGALKLKNLDAAGQAFAAAAKLAPKDPDVIRALGDLQKARDASTAEADAKKIADEVDKLLVQGYGALKLKNLEGAGQAFAAAAKLAPKDPDVVKALQELQKARDASTAEADAKKIAAEVDKLLAQGYGALKLKNLEGAGQAFAAAAKLAPKDPDVIRALGDLQKARDAATAEADAKKIAAEVDKLLVQGYGALKLKNLEGAGQAFAAAAKLAPKDPDVIRALGDLQKARDAATADADAKKIKVEVDKLLTQGYGALKVKNFPAAGQAFAAAAKLGPKDPDVLRAQADLQKAQDAATAEADAKKIAAEVDKLVAQARAAMQQKNYPAAAQALAAAAKLAPKDPDVLKAQQDLKNAQDAGAAEAKRKQEFDRLMAEGQKDMAAKKYDEAVKDYQEALKLMPGDPLATRLLGEAQKALAASQAAAKNEAAYNQAMQQGAAAEKQKNWDAAVQAYQQALKLVPNDAKATAALKNAQSQQAAEAKTKQQFDQHMNDGRKALQAKKFPAAIQAFEAALKLMPGNAEATKLLQQAKQGK